MWSNLPFDLLAYIFTYLSPDSLARAKAACRNWSTAADSSSNAVCPRRHPPWFVSMPTGAGSISFHAHNPTTGNWHFLPLDPTVTTPVKPIASIGGGLLLLKLGNSASLQLAICNPFTKQFKPLPDLNLARTNPAVGIVDPTPNCGAGFRIYVAGGMSVEKSGGCAIYQPNIEIYDSFTGRWETSGKMPVEFAVRVTVWTPNESVYSNGTLYWMTSARAYSLMGLDISTNTWRELSVPFADKLEFAALVPRNGRLAVVGGACGGDGCVWELGDGGGWSLIGKVPSDLGVRVSGVRADWGRVKCVGIEGAVCLYRDSWSGIIVWRESEWGWIDGCCYVKGREIPNFPIRGFLIYPNLIRSAF